LSLTLSSSPVSLFGDTYLTKKLRQTMLNI
jgi:hypothetical protein